ncbi:MAG: hypothetical protein ACJAZ3_001327 [Sphingobacteriales bacterium]
MKKSNWPRLVQDWHLNALSYIASEKINITDNDIDKIAENVFDLFKSEVFSKPFDSKKDKFQPIFRFGKIDSSISWINSLLYSKPSKSIQSLFDLNQIIEYYKTADPILIHNLFILAKNNDRDIGRQFKDTLFEFYTFYVLDFNEIPNVKKNHEGEKELEGTLELLNSEFLFECKKVYSTSTSVVNTAFELISQLNKTIAKINTPCSLYFNLQPQLNGYWNEVLNKKRGFSQQVQAEIETNMKGDNKIILDPHLEPFFVLDYIPYSSRVNINPYLSQNVEIHISHPFRDYGVLAQKHNIQLAVNYRLTSEETWRKFKSVLKKKRNNRKSSKYKNRIYFFDNEHFAGFEQPLFCFPLHEDLDKEITNYAIDKYEDDIKEIYVIFERNYRESPSNYSPKLHVYCHPNLNLYKEEILKWKLPCIKNPKV